MVIILILAADKEYLGLPGPDGQVGQLWKVVLQNDTLNQIARNLLRAVSLIQKEDHWLVLVVLLEAVVEGTYVEDAAFASGLGLLVLADDDEGRQPEDLPDHVLEVVEAFGELEDEVEADEALAEDHY